MSTGEPGGSTPPRISSAGSGELFADLFVLRHGEPSDTRLFYGHHDVELSDRGQRQAEAQGEFFEGRDLDLVASSDLQRARASAAAILQRAQVRTSLEDPRLREMSLGDLEAVPHERAAVEYPEWVATPYSAMLSRRMPGGGESIEDVAARVRPWLLARALDAGTSPVRETPTQVVLCTHNSVCRILLCWATGAPLASFARFEQRYGGMNRIRVRCKLDREKSPESLFCDLVAGMKLVWSNRAAGADA